MRILIAEDDPITRRLLEATLGKGGYEIEMYNNGEAAWALQYSNRVSEWM